MKFRKLTCGFSLIEVTLAIGIVGFGLIAIMGLLPVGLTSNRNAAEQAAATGILTSIASDLRATPVTTPPGGTATSLQYQIAIPASPVSATPAPITMYFAADGSFSKTSATGMRYRARIGFLPNLPSPSPTPGTLVREATYALIKVSWPAPVDPATTQPSGLVTSFVAVDRN
ncbi:MAG: hypothetical protein H0X40_00495 [Chthoniobacterales bacterium]|nr:hypothetical protein [Chthoniobacterales bacterium]